MTAMKKRNRPYRFSWKVKDVKYDVVILPWGATEPHNLHLPDHITDCILPHDIAVDAAALARWNVPACAAW